MLEHKKKEKMEYSMSSNKGIITTSSLSSSSRSFSPSSSSSSSSPSTNYPPSPPAAVTSPPSSFPEPSSSSSSSPNSPPTDLSPTETSLPSASWSTVLPATTTPVAVTVVVISSCAACKYLGRSCEENCVLATCFPDNDLIKFNAVHRVFGAINIINVLQELPESQRAEAVNSMVYEANARLRDPVYGCVRAIFQLQKQVSYLQAQLVERQAEVIKLLCQQANLKALLCMETNQSPQASSPQQSLDNFANTPMSFLDNTSLGSEWEPLWT